MVEPVGKRLRRLRLAAGMSQRDLSSPGVSYAYISRIEAGVRTPSVKALRRLAPKLGVSPHYLEHGSEAEVHVLARDTLEGFEPLAAFSNRLHAELWEGRLVEAGQQPTILSLPVDADEALAELGERFLAKSEIGDGSELKSG